MRSEKGSITVYVLLAMLTLTAFLMAIYIKNSNTEMAQLETTEKIKAIYEDYNMDEVYATMKNGIPKVLGYEKEENKITIKTLVEDGINVDQNGKEILYYAATNRKEAPKLEKSKQEIQMQENFGQWQKGKEIGISPSETTIYLWIMNEEGLISDGLEIK